MNGPTVTYWILVATVAGLAGYDVFALTVWGPQATLSDVAKQLGAGYPVFDFLAGLIVGHLIWPVLGDRKRAKFRGHSVV